MKRLLRITFDMFLLSITSVVSWFLLGILVDKNLINIFTVTYPTQFIYAIIISIFSVGANISKEKDNNCNAVMSGLSIGTILGTLIFGLLAIFVDKYILFMNMDVEVYRIFTRYFFIMSIFTLIFSFILNKLYYEDKNKLANKYSVVFNVLWFCVLIGTSLITKNQLVITTVTIIILGIYTIGLLVKTFDKFKYKLDISNCIRYNSVEICSNLLYFIIFLFGISNTLEFGAEYANALAFVGLITDPHSDGFGSIVTAAQIDISKKRFNYKKHMKDAYKLLMIIITSMVVSFIALFNLYDLNLKITLIYFAAHLITFSLYPGYRIKMCYLQIEWSAFKTTINKLSTQVIRTLFSFIHSPFCTMLGQLAAGFYQFITMNIMFFRHYKVDKRGFIRKRGKKIKHKTRIKRFKKILNKI